jgi:hypothetical protein
MQITIPFQERWRDAILDGSKSSTTRTKRYGRTGDTFEAFGADFELASIEKMTLEDVSETLHEEEGCGSPAEFRALWAKLHPRKGFVPHQSVYVHRFRGKAQAP